MYRIYLAAMCAMLVCCQKSEKTIVLVLPVEHTALMDIQSGFVSTLKASHPEYQVEVKNAMGDPSLMQSIMRTTASQNVDYVATVGVSTTTAAKKLCKDKVVIGLAAYKELSDVSTHIVEDEIGAETLCASVKHMFPGVKKVTLVHAQDDKILKEATQLEKLMKAGGVDVQMLPVLHTNDLQTVCPHIQGEVVLILKDHTVVSGLNVLRKYTEEHSIPLVASDEGSVKQGATYAFGVSERDTGVKGAEIIGQLIDKKKVAKVVKLDPMYIVSTKTPVALLERMKSSKVHNVELAGHAHS